MIGERILEKIPLKEGFTLYRVINRGGVPYSCIVSSDGLEIASCPTDDEASMMAWWNE